MATEDVKHVSVRVPATTANLGPGFDCLGLALDLWNETTFSLSEGVTVVEVHGEGAGQIPLTEDNLILQATSLVYIKAGKRLPTGLKVICENHIPLKSGLGSSSAAVLAGLLGGNALVGEVFGEDELFELGVEIEGHPDNLAPALYGGLVLVSPSDDKLITHRIHTPIFEVVVILPEVDLSTKSARQILPEKISYHDALFNLSRVPLVVEAFRSGDFDLLAAAMHDRLHQPYRLPLIPGAERSLKAVQKSGIPAALSGAGPSLIAFVRDGQGEEVAEMMQKEFDRAGVRSRLFYLSTSPVGAQVNLHVDGS
jgi:homoserine kinase